MNGCPAVLQVLPFEDGSGMAEDSRGSWCMMRSSGTITGGDVVVAAGLQRVVAAVLQRVVAAVLQGVLYIRCVSVVERFGPLVLPVYCASCLQLAGVSFHHDTAWVFCVHGQVCRGSGPCPYGILSMHW